jgi:uncharacterized membrane protein (UPF0127 family)
MPRVASALPLWGVVLLASITACTAGGEFVSDEAAPRSSAAVPTDSASSSTGPGSSVPGTLQVPVGFSEVGLRIVADTAAGLRATEMCVWEAATPEQRSRGLMWVTNLGGRNGMVFVYEEDRSTSFTMRNTLIDLSIAFFDAQGRFMDAFDMEPCREEPCRNYPTPNGFRLALEVPAGDLGRWGIGSGSVAFLKPHCDTP